MNVDITPPSTIFVWRGTVTTSAASLAALAPAFQTSHNYSKIGEVFSNANIAYAVVKTGTSGSTAPTGTGPSIADASGLVSAPIYRAIVNTHRAIVRNLDASATIDAGNSSVTAGGGTPIMGGSPVGETLVQEIDSPSDLYLVAGASVAVSIEVY